MDIPWSVWAAAPEATMRAKFRAMIVSMVAPQTPTLPYGSLAFSRHGPIEQCLQHAESAPIGHAFMLAARSKAVSTPSFLAFSSICAVASQMVASFKLRTFFSFFSLPASLDFSGIYPPVITVGLHHPGSGSAPEVTFA